MLYQECIGCDYSKFDEGVNYCDCPQNKEPLHCPLNNEVNRYHVEMNLPTPNSDYNNN